MKKASRIVSLLLMLAIMATMFVVTPVSASAASLNYKSVVVAVEDEFTIKLRKAKGEVEWSSADEDIATVSNGVIKGVSTGKTTVKAEYNDKTYSCKVSVKKYVIDGSKKMTVNETQTLKVKGDTDGKTIKWSSSDTDVAAVNSKGKVTAKKAGTAKIYAKIGNKKYAMTITVSKSISLNASKITLDKGNNYTLKASNVPEGKKVTWSSSDESVAAVNSKGYVTALKAGTTTITAKAGKAKSTCKVTVTSVKKYPLPNKLTFDEMKDSSFSIDYFAKGLEWGMSVSEVKKIKGIDTDYGVNDEDGHKYFCVFIPTDINYLSPVGFAVMYKFDECDKLNKVGVTISGNMATDEIDSLGVLVDKMLLNGYKSKAVNYGTDTLFLVSGSFYDSHNNKCGTCSIYCNTDINDATYEDGKFKFLLVCDVYLTDE